MKTFIDLCRARAALGDEYGLTGKFNVIFAGTMGAAQALDECVRRGREVARLCGGSIGFHRRWD